MGPFVLLGRSDHCPRELHFLPHVIEKSARIDHSHQMGMVAVAPHLICDARWPSQVVGDHHSILRRWRRLWCRRRVHDDLELALFRSRALPH